jgi:hypothetical protein
MLNKIITAELTGVIRMRIEGVLPSSSRGLIRMLRRCLTVEFQRLDPDAEKVSYRRVPEA